MFVSHRIRYSVVEGNKFVIVAQTTCGYQATEKRQRSHL